MTLGPAPAGILPTIPVEKFMEDYSESFSPNYSQQSTPKITLKPPALPSSGLTLVLPSLKTLQASKAVKKSKQRHGSYGIQEVEVSEKKIPRPVKLKPLKEVLTKLIYQIKKKDDYAFFLRPVDPEKVPGYSDVVKCPMDLGTMTEKVSRGRYRSLDEFTSDLQLVTTNAKIFNPPGTIYYSEAERIEAWALDHIAKAAATVIQYETDWNIEIDDEGPTVNIDDDDGDNVATPMDVDDPISRGRSGSVASQPQPGMNRRGPRGPYNKRSGNAMGKTVTESIDVEGRLPGSKDGLGAFPPGSDWARTMVALKLKGKRFRTKKERLRFEKEGPPYLPDGSLDYTEIEDPFSVLSVFVPAPPTRPHVTALFPPFTSHPVSNQNENESTSPPPIPPPPQTSFPTAVNVPLDYSPDLPTFNTDTAPSKRRHWVITRNTYNRSKGKEKDDEGDISEIPSWQVPREVHAADFGSFALLSGRLAEEMKNREIENTGQQEEEEQVVFDTIRASLHCPSSKESTLKDEGLSIGIANGISTDSRGYWNTQRAVEAEEYIRDIVYGGVDGLAYVRSLAEFVSIRNPENLSSGIPSSSGLGMPLAKWVEQNVVDPLTDGRHALLREAAKHLALRISKSSATLSKDVNDSVARQVSNSLNLYPAAAIALSALLQITSHKIDMGALIKTPEELFQSEEEWAGKQFSERKSQCTAKAVDSQAADPAEVEEPERTWMDVDISLSDGKKNGESNGHYLESPEEIQEVLAHVSGIILDLNRRIVEKGIKGHAKVDTEKTDSVSEPTEDSILRNLRLNLLALAKRAPLDTIARLPEDLVPEHIRHYVPTLGPSS